MSEENDLATQKLNELRERASKDFNRDEINNFITMGKQLASKAVLSALVCVLRENGPVDDIAGKSAREKESARLIKKIEKLMPYDYSGFVTCSFKEIPYILNITLSLVNRDYKTDIDIPHESYAKDLFEQYNFLKNIACAYWRQFSEENPTLIERIAKHRPDVDFNSLVVDQNSPTTLYFDANCPRRIGLFCYYTHEGRTFYKKTKN
jgi:hypothetical protein